MREILSKTEPEREDILSRDFEQEVFPMGCLKWCNEKIITPKVTLQIQSKGVILYSEERNFLRFCSRFFFCLSD